SGVGLNSNVPSIHCLSYQNAASIPSTQIRFKPPVAGLIAQLSVRPKILNFGNVLSQQDSVSMSVTVANVGPTDATGGTLKIFATSMTNSTDYTITTPVIDSIVKG